LEAFPTIRLQKSHVHEILQEAIGDLQEDLHEDLHEDAEGCFIGFKCGKIVDKGVEDQRDVLRCLKFTKEV